MPSPLDQLFALYQQSFPTNERRTASDLCAALATPDYQLVTRVENGTLIGFAILFIPPAADFALLEYLAVDPTRRSAGIGSNLVHEAIEKTRPRCLLIEVESQTADPATIRRQRFYEKCNFSRIDGLNYLLPLPGNPPRMELWANPASAVNRAKLRDWISTIYVDVYHRPPADPRIAVMQAQLRA